MLLLSEKPTDEEDGSDSFVDKLAAQVVKNLKVRRKSTLGGCWDERKRSERGKLSCRLGREFPGLSMHPWKKLRLLITKCCSRASMRAAGPGKTRN